MVPPFLCHCLLDMFQQYSTFLSIYAVPMSVTLLLCVQLVMRSVTSVCVSVCFVRAVTFESIN